MPYAAITARRMPFDIDGTAIGYGSTIANGITSWLSSQNKVDLNSAGDYSVTFNNTTKSYWFFFPEIREVTHLMIHLTARCDSLTIQGSTDSTNGLDGNWETPTYTWPGEDF
jgi:hypothetical protein